MTPTPEMESFALEAALKHFGTCSGLMIRIMSVAVMEAQEKAAHHLLTLGEFEASEAIRNGEHLRCQ